MTLTLDPRYPLVWRTPDSLQLGVDDPPVLLESVSLGHERMLAGLRIGLTLEGLKLIGTESGLTEHQMEEFRLKIQPALAVPNHELRARIVLAGKGPTIDRLGLRLAEAGLDPRATGPTPNAAAKAVAHTTVSSAQPATPDLAIVVGHYVLDPDFRGIWLRRDIPHLPIVYADTSVTIGPMIVPGTGPCLYCLELHRRDADFAWPALASQLLGRRATTELPFLASEVATLATRMILNKLASEIPGAATSMTLDAVTGKATSRSHSRHPECACAGITGLTAERQPRTASASSRPNVGPSNRPTTTEVACVPA